MQILPGFFLHFSSNFAHLSHIHRLFLSFFLDFRPSIPIVVILKRQSSFGTILAIFDLPKDQKNYFLYFCCYGLNGLGI